MLSYIVLLFLFPFLISAFFFWWKKESHPISGIACCIYFSDLMMDVVCYLLKEKSILNIIDPQPSFFLKYFLGTFFCVGIVFFAQHWIKEKGGLPIYRKTTLLFGSLFSGISVYILWLLSESGRQSFELVYYNLTNPVNTEVANFETTMFGLGFFILLLIVCLIIILKEPIHWRKAYFKQRHRYSFASRILAFFLPLLLFCSSLYLPVYALHLEDAYSYFYAESEYIETHYVDPNTVTLTWPQKKQNLVYIFLESFEASSFSKELGGLQDKNLLPNLTNFMEMGTYFSNHERYYGGAYTMPQASVTIAGMVAALGGVNYKIPIELEKDDDAAVVPNLTTLNDLLYEQGYEEHFMIGSYTDAYHIGPFYRAHGNATTIGWPDKIESGELPEDYKVWWGFEDKKLYEYAKEDITKLSASNTLYLYVLSSNDTHRTDGYTDPTCPFDYTYPMENAIACADQLLGDFLTWFQQQPFYEDTTIVIVGDHLAHEEAYTKTLEPQSERRIFNLILNAKSTINEGSHQNREFWAADMFPTVLSAIGVQIEGNRLGLGTNLFSDVPTLIEETSIDYVTELLSQNSRYYTEHFLMPSK